MTYFPTLTDHGLNLILEQPKLVQKQSDCLKAVEQEVNDELLKSKYAAVHIYRLVEETDGGFVLIKDRTVMFDKDFTMIWADLHRKME